MTDTMTWRHAFFVSALCRMLAQKRLAQEIQLLQHVKAKAAHKLCTIAAAASSILSRAWRAQHVEKSRLQVLIAACA
jgi:hypothetical protein